MSKIDPTTFKPGDIVYVRGKVDCNNLVSKYVSVDVERATHSFNYDEIVAHFPAIRSWSEIDARLIDLLEAFDGSVEPTIMATNIIALLNEIDPKGDA
jgi:hypothetical protein